MDLPAFAPYPPSRLRSLILPAEWDAFLDSWSSLAEAYLSLPTEAFTAASQEKNSSLINFLSSIFKETAEEGSPRPLGSREMRLRRLCFMLTKRLGCGKEVPRILGNPSFLGDFCLVYNGSRAIGALIDKLWDEQSLQSSLELAQDKVKLIHGLESLSSEDLPDSKDGLRRLAAIMKSSTSWNLFLMHGSDFFDALVSAWDRTTEYHRTKMIRIMFFALTSLLKGRRSSISLLLDHLFSLLALHDRKRESQEESILLDLVSKTPILRKIQFNDAFLQSARSQKLLQSLRSFGSLPKGKSKQTNHEDVHVHKLRLVSEVQDLFPHHSIPTVVKLLDKFDNDTENVVAYLLDNPDQLMQDHKMQDRQLMESEIFPIDQPTASKPSPTELMHPKLPHDSRSHLLSFQAPDRRNVFDGDEFDRFEISAANLHIGHKETRLEPPTSQNKAAILSALAVFDSDSDERDDTYDIDDVGGTVDNTLEIESVAHSNEGVLYAAWKSSPEAFSRDAATRRGKSRLALKNDSGMSDEAIEGWALVLERNPRQLSRLEAKYASFRGEQTQLASTAWRPDDAGAEEEENSHRFGVEDNRERGGMRGRAMYRGRGGGARGAGNVVGSAGEKDTQLARQRKDVNKSSRANHNRRNQRARKVARAGFPAAG